MIIHRKNYMERNKEKFGENKESYTNMCNIHLDKLNDYL